MHNNNVLHKYVLLQITHMFAVLLTFILNDFLIKLGTYCYINLIWKYCCLILIIVDINFRNRCVCH